LRYRKIIEIIEIIEKKEKKEKGRIEVYLDEDCKMSKS